MSQCVVWGVGLTVIDRKQQRVWPEVDSRFKLDDGN